MEKANDFAQIMMYLHVITLVSDASKFLFVHRDDLEKCEETLRRIEEIVEIYNLRELNFNVVAVFLYQMADIYCQHGKKKEAVEQLKKFTDMTLRFLRGDGAHLKCDEYFDRLNVWHEKNILGGNLPREKKLIYDSLRLIFEAPQFELLKEEPAFISLKKSVLESGKVW